jgi:hypothetical protein
VREGQHAQMTTKGRIKEIKQSGEAIFFACFEK